MHTNTYEAYLEKANVASQYLHYDPPFFKGFDNGKRPHLKYECSDREINECNGNTTQIGQIVFSSLKPRPKANGQLGWCTNG